MLNKKMLLITSLLLPCVLYCLYEMTWMRPSDLDRYEELVKEKRLASSDAQIPTNQHRKGVSKEIWFSQDDSSRLHYQISSEGSLLTLTPFKNKFEIVEVLSGIKCWMQDKLYEETNNMTPMQQTRFIEAEEGQYRYTTQEFTANGVTLSLFRLPGHELPQDSVNAEDAFLRGIARDVSFHLGGKTPQFKAEHFQATVVKE
jgi:hypothetical protein